MKIHDPKNHVEMFNILAEECEEDYQIDNRRLRDTLLVQNDLLSHINFPEGCKVLDIGPGSGWLLSLLPQKKVEYWGVDPAPAVVRRLRKKCSHLSYVHIEKGSSEDLPKVIPAFDRVVCHSVFCLFPTCKSFELTLQEFWRVTKPGSEIWMGECPFRNEIEYLNSSSMKLSRLIKKLQRKILFRNINKGSPKQVQFAEVLPTFYLPLEIVRDKAESIGFEVEVFPCVGTNFFPKTRVNYLLRRRL